MTGKEIVLRQSSDVAIGGAAVPPAVRSGLADLMTAFATASQRDLDKPRLLRLYAEATRDFQADVVAAALQWLKLHNPRNPFHPTPQDLFEACENFRETWRSRVVAHFTGADAAWPQPIYFKRELPWGNPPLTDGCPVPARLVRELLATWLAEQGDKAVEPLAALGRERLGRIPSQCFVGGQLDKARDLIAEIERKRAEEERERAYVASLEPKLREARARVLRSGCWGPAKPETDLIAEAKKLLEADERNERFRGDLRQQEAARTAAHRQPSVQAATKRMWAAEDAQDEAAWLEAAQSYVAELAAFGAKPAVGFRLMMPLRVCGRIIGRRS